MSTETLTARELRLGNEYVQLLTDKTVLITGAAGYLGTALLSSLYGIRCRIVALVHQRSCLPLPSESNASLSSQHADLSQTSVWRDVLRESKPDVVINLAAYEHRRDSPHAPELDLAVNAATILELLDACRELDLRPRIVQASSANIVGCPSSPVVNEDTPDQPLTLYAINKQAAEGYLRHYAESFDIPTVALRFGNIYGPLPLQDTELETRVVLNSIMNRALAGGPLYLYANYACVRDFLYVDDAVSAICAVAASESVTPGASYIVGSGECHSLRQIVNEIARQAELLRSTPIEVQSDTQVALAPIEWREFIADYSRLRSATGWEPQISLRRGIDLTLRTFLAGTGGQSR
jgi:UDP-glucose 4-epimerase